MTIRYPVKGEIEMIVIESIKCFETDERTMQVSLSRFNHSDLVPINKGKRAIEARQYNELVQGVRFRRPDDTEIIVGMSKQAQEVIGLQYESWQRMQDRLDRYAAENDNLHKQASIHWDMLRSIKTAKFLTRLKWLFVGVEY